MKWQGITKCDFEGDTNCNLDPYFVDGKTTSGPWALMCPKHYQLHGIGLGVGKGQKYDSQTLEKLEG